MDESLTFEELKDLKDNAVWERDHIGAPNSIIRKRAASLIKLIDKYTELVNDHRDLQSEHATLQGKFMENGY